MVAKAKFRIEGEDATAAAFRSALGNAKTTADGMQKQFKAAFLGISAYGLIAGIRGTIGAAIEMGDELNKAAIKAGIGGKAISELAHAAKMSDIELDSLSTSLKKMQVNLSEAATGGKAQKESLDALGIALQDIKGLAADKQFELIADRISQLKDPADRARAATELFGKAGADLLPMFEQGAEGIRKAREEAQKLGLSFTPEQLKTFADADDALKRLKASGEGLAAALTLKLAPSLSYVAREMESLVSGRQIDKLATLREEIRVLENSLSPARLKDPFVSMGEFGGAPDVAAGFYDIEERKKKLEELRTMLSAMDGTMDDFAARQARARQGADNANAAPGYVATVANASESGLDDVTVSAKKIGQELRNEHNESLADMLADTRTFARSEVDEYESKMRSLQTLRDERVLSEKEYLERVAYWQGYYDDKQLSAVEVTAQRSAETWRDSLDTMSVYADQAARNMQDAFAEVLFDPFDDGLKGLLDNFINVIRRMAAEAAAAQIFGSKADGGFGLGDLFRIGVGAATSSGSGADPDMSGPGFNDYGGGMANGGPLESGKWYTAGEHGPEAIWGGGPGAYAAGYGGNRITIAPVYQVDARGATQDFVKQLPAILEANSRRTVDMARAAVMDDLSRRGQLRV